MECFYKIPNREGTPDRHPARVPQKDTKDPLVEAWEAKHYPLDLPDAIEAIRYHLEQNGLAPRDLVPFIGKTRHIPATRSRMRALIC